MKNIFIKIIVLIFTLIIATTAIFAITAKCYAVSDITEDLDFWKPDNEGSSEIDRKIEIIVGIVRVVGILVSVGTLSVIGIKFMLGSVEEKAQYKQTLLPWLTGAVLVFTLTTLPTFIFNMINGANEIEQIQLALNQSSVTLKLGENEEVTLKVLITIDTAEVSRNVKWTSSNRQVATVDSNGKVTAKSQGRTVIKAFSGKAVATCEVIVDAVKTTNITLSTNSLTFNESSENPQQLTATLTPSNSVEPINWSSSNNDVATVSNGSVRAIGNGTATITVTSGEKTATCTVQVNIAEENPGNVPEEDGELNSSRAYLARYYNPSTGRVTSTRATNNDLGFWIYKPDTTSTRKLPLIVFLHGSGECGSDLNVLKNLRPFYLEEKDYPAIVIYPQCPSGATWVSIAEKVKGLIDYSIANYNVNADKVALTGFSWGGSGTWEIGLQYPTLFSCLVPVCGYSSISATVYPDCPVWTIGSTGDGTYEYSKKIGELLTAEGKKVKVDKRSARHTAMQADAYTDTLINWMIQRSRATNSNFEF